MDKTRNETPPKGGIGNNTDKGDLSVNAPKDKIVDRIINDPAFEGLPQAAKDRLEPLIRESTAQLYPEGQEDEAKDILKRKAKQIDTAQPHWGNQKVTAAQAIGAMMEYAQLRSAKDGNETPPKGGMGEEVSDEEICDAFYNWEIEESLPSMCKGASIKAWKGCADWFKKRTTTTRDNSCIPR